MKVEEMVAEAMEVVAMVAGRWRRWRWSGGDGAAEMEAVGMERGRRGVAKVWQRGGGGRWRR